MLNFFGEFYSAVAVKIKMESWLICNFVVVFVFSLSESWERSWKKKKIAIFFIGSFFFYYGPYFDPGPSLGEMWTMVRKALQLFVFALFFQRLTTLFLPLVDSVLFFWFVSGFFLCLEGPVKINTRARVWEQLQLYTVMGFCCWRETTDYRAWENLLPWVSEYIITPITLFLSVVDPILFVCFIPAAAGIFLLFIPNKQFIFIRFFVTASSVITCFLSQCLLVTTSHLVGSLIPNIYPWIFGDQIQTQLFFSFSTGVDGISLFFLLLTTLVFPFCFLSLYKKVKSLKFYCFCLLFLESFLLFAFGVSDLLFFFFFFESVLLPMFFIIGIWGSGYQRIRAAYYFFFFTLAGSVFSLVAIFIVFTINGSTLFYIILNSGYIDWQVELLLFFFFGLGFSVKMPMFPLHTWLPEAHVQSPTEGSVILASLLLKLGGYGFLRLLIPGTGKATIFCYPIVATLAICGIIFCSMSASVQVDLKKLIAYSSAAHMNLIVLGIFSLNLQGIQGSLLLMLAHGFASSGLFFLIGFLYDRHHTRTINYYSGLAQSMPIYTTTLFLFILANVSFPLTANFVGEFLIFVGIMQKSFLSAFLSAFGVIVLSPIYSFFAFGRLAFLETTEQAKSHSEITFLEFHTVWYFLFLILILGINPNLVLDMTNYSVLFLLLY
jgi:proton-translocating NADH-quinone oxidoreductase chain M